MSTITISMLLWLLTTLSQIREYIQTQYNNINNSFQFACR